MLSGTVAANAVDGVATFSDLSIKKAAKGYTLVASSQYLAGATSTPFSVDPGPPDAAHSSVQCQPTTVVADGTATAMITATARDAYDNPVPDQEVQLASTGSGNTLTQPASTNDNGVASGAIASTKAESKAIEAAVGSGTSQIQVTQTASIAFIAGPAAQIVLVSGNDQKATVGKAISNPLVVRVSDGNGNPVSGHTVSFLVTAGGGSVSPPSPTTDNTGQAAASLTLGLTSGNHVVEAAAVDAVGQRLGGSPVLFRETGTPDAEAGLTFLTQPSNAMAGAGMAPAVKAGVVDAHGNVVTSATGTIVLALASNTVGGTLSGAVTQPLESGIATFGGLSVDKAGAGYMLRATSGTLAAKNSNSFSIVPGAAASVRWVTEPSDSTAAKAIDPVRVEVLDACGNRVESDNSVTIALASGAPGGVLSGTLTQSTDRGLASFPDLSINKADEGTPYQLRAACGALTPIPSSTFKVLAGAPASLRFDQQPSDTASGGTVSPSVTVVVLDAAGNPVTTAAAVTLGIGANPGGGGLVGTKTVAAVNGVATFNDLTIARAAAGYTLQATATGLSSTESKQFAIRAGVPAKLEFSKQPPSRTASGTAMSVEVRVLDAADNPVDTATNLITLDIGSGRSDANPTVGNNPANALNGVVVFDEVRIDMAGQGYTLRASAAGLTPKDSNTFTIEPGQASKLAFTTQPGDPVTSSAVMPAVVVSVQDAAGNLVPSATDTVSLAIGTNPGGGALTGTTSQGAGRGTASFIDLIIDKAGVGYTLRASAPGLAAATCAAFNVVAGSGGKLVFMQEPTNAAAATPIAPSVRVQAQDAAGNPATTFTGTVILSVASGPAGATLSQTSATAAGGTATFASLSIDKAGTYSLRASAPGMVTATSQAFDIRVGPAARLAFGAQPSNATAGAAITPAIQVQILDAGGNVVTPATDQVTLSIGDNPGNGTLSGAQPQSAVSGVATFSGLSINRPGSGYTLSAASGVLAATTSSAFNIGVGAPAALRFGAQPVGTAAEQPIAPAVTVQVIDAAGNLVDTATNEVTLAIATNPSGGTLAGGGPVSAASGTAVFSALRIDKAGAGYVLQASAQGLTAAPSNEFAITVGAAAKLRFRDQPANSQTGAAITPPVTIEVLDAGANLVTTATDSVTVALAANPGGGTLSGTKTRPASAGLVTFDDLIVDRPGAGYTLTATSGTLTGGTSGAFTVISVPASVTASASISAVAANGWKASAITATVLDGAGQPLAGATVSFSITGTAPDGSSLNGASPGTVSPTATTDAAGKATATFTPGTVGAKVTLTASVSGGNSPSATVPLTVVGQILFNSERDGNCEIYAMNPDGSGQTRLTASAGRDEAPAWSPDGTQVAFSSTRDGSYEIYVMAADGKFQTRLTTTGGLQSSPAWSPDGKKIAFNSTRDVSAGQIYVMNADGTNQVRLTQNSWPDGMPSWSPDGAKIAFQSSREPANEDEVYVMNADATGQTNLTNNVSAYDHQPAWSPNGLTIAYASFSDSGGGYRIALMNGDGSNKRTLLGVSGKSDWQPAWGPGGLRIAFTSNRDGNDNVWVMNADGSGQERLTTHSASDGRPSWCWGNPATGRAVRSAAAGARGARASRLRAVCGGEEAEFVLTPDMRSGALGAAPGVLTDAGRAASVREDGQPAGSEHPISYGVASRLRFEALATPAGLRSPVSGRSWEFLLHSLPDQDTLLSWPDLSSLGAKERVTLEDVDANVRRNMRTSASYVFRGESRRFRVTAEKRGPAALMITELALEGAGRGNARVARVTLSAAADLDLDVITPTGALLAEVARAQALPAGTSRVPLRANLPPGLYLLRARARSEDQTVVQSVRPVVIAR